MGLGKFQPILNFHIFQVWSTAYFETMEQATPN